MASYFFNNKISNIKSLIKCITLIILFTFSQKSFSDCGLNTSFKNCLEFNQAMTKEYNSRTSFRERGGTSMVPQNIMQGFNILQSQNIPLINNIQELSIATNTESMKERIIQEYLRSKIDGMPWLPLSWTMSQNHIEDNYARIIENLEKSNVEILKSRSKKDSIILTYLFTAIVPHLANNTLVEKVRSLADSLGSLDRIGFWDIRIEIHQEPSLGTLRRVNDYIKTIDRESQLFGYANSIKNLLESMFGGVEIKSFLNRYQVTDKELSIWNKYITSLEKISNSDRPKVLQDSWEDIILNFDKIANISTTYYDKLQDISKINCSRDNSINCSYEILDYLRIMQNSAFSLSNLLFNKFIEFKIAPSIKQIIQMVSALTKFNYSIGGTSIENVKKIDEILESSSNEKVSYNSLLYFISSLEADIARKQQNLSAMFAGQFSIYRKFSTNVDGFIDNILRGSVILPISNWIESISFYLQSLKGIKVNIQNKEIAGNFRVLNTGIAKGRLYMADAEEIKDHSYSYDPNGIYFLPKTPAELHKVEGIITADSGSMVSHVQLLAKNHGLPNIYIGKSLIPKLKKLEGKEIIIYALPNGEAHIKLLSDASPLDIKAYNKYHLIKDRQKVKIHPPKELISYNYPLRLDQLRLSDTGIIAGGKACGQGELIKVFPHMVPAGIVLPFGVYYDHIKKTGIYDEAKRIFKDPTLSKDFKKRKEALKKLRDKIHNIKISKEIKEWIRETLSRKPFINRVGLPRGLFVRSDTNAEDLPNFVGAGLNKTVPNIKGFDRVIKAIKEVWASPFKEKAISWRKDLIENPWEVYPSVIIQIGINSDKAGVMVVGSTQNSDDLYDNVLIAANEGVGISVVDGRFTPEETLYNRKNDAITRLRNTYATSRLSLSPTEGIVTLPTRLTGHIMPDDHIRKLANVGHDIQDYIEKNYNRSGKWDMEWGMVKDRVVLFQIRPFIGNKIIKDSSILEKLKIYQNIQIISLIDVKTKLELK